MLFSRREGRYLSRGPRLAPSGPDPHSPNSPGYAERNRQHVTELPGGMIRIDIGEPVGPPSAPPRKPRKSPKPAAPAAPPAEPAESLPLPPLDPEAEARGRFRLSPPPTR
jgi:hypothetical protein